MRFEIPNKDNVSSANKVVFDHLEQSIGSVPHLFAIMAYSNFGLMRFLSFQNSASSLSKKEKEIVNLVVSEINNCLYCIREHTYIAMMNGFSEEEITAIRSGKALKKKWNALAVFTKFFSENKGKVPDDLLKNLFEAGYDLENLIDIVLQVSENMATNYLFNLTNIPIDFPETNELK